MVSKLIVKFTKIQLVKYKNIELCLSKKIARICSLSMNWIAQSANTKKK